LQGATLYERKIASAIKKLLLTKKRDAPDTETDLAGYSAGFLTQHLNVSKNMIKTTTKKSTSVFFQSLNRTFFRCMKKNNFGFFYCKGTGTYEL
jgi:hypothetical protein